jgi:hypothetical protein
MEMNKAFNFQLVLNSKLDPLDDDAFLDFADRINRGVEATLTPSWCNGALLVDVSRRDVASFEEAIRKTIAELKQIGVDVVYVLRVEP